MTRVDCGRKRVQEKSKTEGPSLLADGIDSGKRTRTCFCPRILDRLHRDSEVPLRGNGANGKEISLGASSRRRALNTETRGYIPDILSRNKRVNSTGR